jgi:predicted tellurium resistance membrane protein TerC
MVDEIAIMIVAIVLAMIVMLLAMERVSGFVEAHPSVKLLALAFLILIGVILVADAFGHHVPKGYIYFSMAFSLGVELLNLRYRRRQAQRRRAA